MQQTDEERALAAEKRVVELNMYLDKVEYERDKAVQDVYIPGTWECPTCHFILVRNFLHAHTGNVSVNDNELDEPCPNDGVIMQRQTWKSRALQAEQIALDNSKRLSAVEGALRRCVDLLGNDRAIVAHVGAAIRDAERLLGTAAAQPAADPEPAEFFQRLADSPDVGPALAAWDDQPAEAVEPCSCGGRRWVEDENWQPEDYESWVRALGSGLIPCGFCNEGGWHVPVLPWRRTARG